MVGELGRGAREKRKGERRRGSWEVVVITNKDRRRWSKLGMIAKGDDGQWGSRSGWG